MGSLTRDLLVSEALQLAGNSSIGTRANVWLQAWLDKTYASYQWPFTTNRYGPFSVAAGAASFEIGDTASGIAASVTEQLSTVWSVSIADTVNSGYKGSLEMLWPAALNPMEDPLWLDSSSPGIPSKVLIEVASSGGYSGALRWKVSFIPVPDKAYRVIVLAGRRPAALSGSSIPSYPNDETMIQAIYVRALKHQQDERWVAEGMELKAMLAEDFVIYGRAGGAQGRLLLSPKIFPGGSNGR